MPHATLPFRLGAERRAAQLQQFRARAEIAWFGFDAAFAEPGTARITFARFADGLLGGGGTAAVNGGVIAAGVDAAFVLAGLGHYDTPVVVTLELSVKYLSLAKVSPTLAFEAEFVRSARHFGFAEGRLLDRADGAARPLAIASAMVAPADVRPSPL